MELSSFAASNPTPASASQPMTTVLQRPADLRTSNILGFALPRNSIDSNSTGGEVSGGAQVDETKRLAPILGLAEELSRTLSSSARGVERDLHDASQKAQAEGVDSSAAFQMVLKAAEHALAIIYATGSHLHGLQTNLRCDTTSSSFSTNAVTSGSGSAATQPPDSALLPLPAVASEPRLPRFDVATQSQPHLHQIPNGEAHDISQSNHSQQSIISPMWHSAELTVDDAGFDGVNHYTIVSELGSGNHGKVMLCYDNVLQQPRAMKFVRRSAVAKSNDTRDAVREVAIMKKLSHKNIVRLYECIDSPSEDLVYLVMQFVDGAPLLRFDEDLHCSPMSLALVKTLMQQLASALSYMHRRGVAHLDIKPDNILVDREGHLFVADFGVSALVTGIGDRHHTQRFRGTPLFAAPEALDGVVGRPADMWATGVTLYAMIFGCLPFLGDSISATIDRVLHGKLTFPPSSPDKLKWRKLICGLLERDPALRLTADQLKDHPLLVSSAGPVRDSSLVFEESTLATSVTEHELRDAFACSTSRRFCGMVPAPRPPLPLATEPSRKVVVRFACDTTSFYPSLSQTPSMKGGPFV